MKKSFLPLLTLLTALLMAPNAIAEVRGGAITVSPFVGGYTFDGSQHLQTNIATGLDLGYNLTENWGVEGRFTWVPLQAAKGDIPGEYSLFNFHGDVLYHFFPEGQFVPYVALGAGLSRTEFLTYDNHDAILVYGGGVKYFFTDWLALRGDVRHIFSFHTNNPGGMDYWNNFQYTVGLSFSFGGGKPVPSAAKPEAISEPVAQSAAPAVKMEAPEQKASALPVQEEKPGPATVKAPAPVLPSAEQAAVLAKEEKTRLAERKIVLTSIALQPNALEIITTENFYYELQTLSKPSRLAIDILDAVNGLGVDSIVFNKIGIATVRIESQGKFLRILLYPMAGTPLPSWSRIDVTGKGLMINMATPTPKKKEK